MALWQNLNDARAALRIGVNPAGKLQVFDGVSGGGSGDAALHGELRGAVHPAAGFLGVGDGSTSPRFEYFTYCT